MRAVTFLNPTLAMVGLLSIAAPIIIHILMRRKRRPITWGAMRFVAEAYRRQRRRMNLEQMLLLLSRCALVALVALAVGKPLIGVAAGGSENGPRTLYILIDNSLSSGLMEPRALPEPDIAQLRASALTLIAALDPANGDRVAVFTVAGPVQAAIFPPTTQLAAARDFIQDIHVTHARAAWPAAIAQVRAEIESDQSASSGSGAGTGGRAGRGSPANTAIALLSHWRAGAIDLEAPLAATEDPRLTWIALPPAVTPVDNISIVAVEPARSVVLASAKAGTQANPTSADNGSVAVRVMFARSGPGVAQPATVTFNARSKTITPAGIAPVVGEAVRGSVSWAAGEKTATAYVTVSASVAAGTGAQRTPAVIDVTLEPDALVGDNHAAAAIQVRDRIDAAIIAPAKPMADSTLGGLTSYSPSDWFALALSPRADTSLRLRQTSDIRVTLIDPLLGIAPSATLGGAGRSAGVLTSFDVLVITQPGAMDAAAWQAVREVYFAGATILVCPHTADEQRTLDAAQVWTDDFVAAMDLDWTFARESRAISPPAALRIAAGYQPRDVTGGAGNVTADPENTGAAPVGAAGVTAAQRNISSVTVGGAVGGVDQGLAQGLAQGFGQPQELLAQIAGELPELIRPVTVQRILDVRAMAFEASAAGKAAPLAAGVAGDGGGGGIGGSGGAEVTAGAATAGFEPLLLLEDGSPFLIVTTAPNGSVAGGARGSIIYFAAPLDPAWTDLPARPLIVALMQELVRSAIGRAAPARTITAGQAAFGLGVTAADLTLVDAFASASVDGQGRGERDVGDALAGDAGAPPQLQLSGGLGQGVIPITARGVSNPLRYAGVYAVRDPSTALIGGLVVNPDAAGGDTAPRTRDDISRWLAPVTDRLRWLDASDPAGATPAVTDSSGVSNPSGNGADVSASTSALLSSSAVPPLSLPLLVAAAVIALIELLFARFFSHADQRSFAPVSGQRVAAPKVGSK